MPETRARAPRGATVKPARSRARRRARPERPVAPAARLLRLQRRAGNRATLRLVRPEVRRMVDWQERETTTMDPILAATEGADWGFTHVLVNGARDTIENPLPLRGPKLGWRTGPGYAFVRAADVAKNTLGTHMEIPKDPPWVADVPKDEIGLRIYGDAKVLGKEEQIEPYAFGGGNTRLRVRGKPTDATMVFHTEEHEQRHVDDDVAAREKIVDPWDEAITKLKSEGRTFKGATPQQAVASLFEAAGGTPQQIGKQFFLEVRKAGIAFHKTKAGSMPDLVEIGTSDDQSTLDLTYQPPV